VVPSTLPERIIGVTDPHDDTMVIWGVLKDGEPPRQLVAGGEFFVVQKVERVVRVGDLVDK
jgi:cytochrome c oxidase subunit 5b